jgi:hypothetical protein
MLACQCVDSACEGVDVVVHLAGTPDDADFPSDILPNNVQGMHNLLQAAVVHRCLHSNKNKTQSRLCFPRVKRIVFASSMQVNWYQLIDAAASCPPAVISPSHPPTPRYWCPPLPQKLSPPFRFEMPPHRYASAKLFCEGIGSAYARLHRICFIAARLGWCPRPGQEVAARCMNPSVTRHASPTGRFRLRGMVQGRLLKVVAQASPPAARSVMRVQPRGRWPVFRCGSDCARRGAWHLHTPRLLIPLACSQLLLSHGHGGGCKCNHSMQLQAGSAVVFVTSRPAAHAR